MTHSSQEREGALHLGAAQGIAWGGPERKEGAGGKILYCGSHDKNG